MAELSFPSTHQTYLFSYRHDGAEWTMEIKARDAGDAKERLKALAFARYDGELIAKFPASAGLLARAAVRIRNIWRTF